MSASGLSNHSYSLLLSSICDGMITLFLHHGVNVGRVARKAVELVRGFLSLEGQVWQ